MNTAVYRLLPTILLLIGNGPTTLSAGGPASHLDALQTPDPDRLYADREHLPSALEAGLKYRSPVKRELELKIGFRGYVPAPARVRC